jgi:two-component system alkaline phosphatase synthesis response regulator PhoP
MAKKILVIEDEAAQVLLLRSRLEARGFHVVSAMNGKDGLRKATEERPDLILLDIVVPDMNGLMVCERIKQTPEIQHIPVILVTASGMKSLEERCKVFGADDCLIKPYQLGELLTKIQALLAGGSTVGAHPRVGPSDA